MQGGQGLCRESGKCLFGGSGIGKGAKSRVGNREKNRSGIGKMAFWRVGNRIFFEKIGNKVEMCSVCDMGNSFIY